MGYNKSRIAAAMLATTALLAITACSSGSGSAVPSSNELPDEVTLPLLIATSGPQAIYAPYFITSTQMAADDINAEGGIGGKTRITLETVDTQGEPDKAVTAFSRVFDGANTPYVLSAFSSQTLALLPIVEQRGAVMANGGAQNEELGGRNPYLYNTLPLINNEADALGSYLAGDGGYKTAAILYTDDDGGTASADAFEKAFTGAGGEVVGKASGELNGTDFRSQLATLRSKSPDMLFLGVFGATNKTIIDQLGELGWDVQLANTSWVNVPEVTSSPGGVGLIYSSMEWHPSEEFAARFKEMSGREANISAIGNYYDAVIAFATAYEAAAEKGYGLDAAGLGKAMDEITFESSYGNEVSFVDGVLDRPIAVSQVQPNGSSKVIAETAGD